MDASLDENSVPTLIAALDSDGETITRVQASPTTHGLIINDDTTGSDNGPENALHDGNGRPTLIAVSSADGITPVVVYVDSNGALLVDSS